MRVGKLVPRQIFGVVNVKDEQTFGIQIVDHPDSRAAGMEMKTIDDQTDIAAIRFLDYFVGDIESLNAAIFLPQKFKRERHAVSFSDRGQLSQHCHGPLDHFIAAQAARRDLTRDDHHVRALDRLGDRAQLFAFGSDLRISGGVAKGGDVKLYVDGSQVGEGRVEHTVPMVFSADETTDVGCDSATPVSDDHGTDNAFTGRVLWVQLDVDEAAEDLDHLITPEERLRLAMARQ